jgi:hypothetical protein
MSAARNAARVHLRTQEKRPVSACPGCTRRVRRRLQAVNERTRPGPRSHCTPSTHIGHETPQSKPKSRVDCPGTRNLWSRSSDPASPGNQPRQILPNASDNPSGISNDGLAVAANSTFEGSGPQLTQRVFTSRMPLSLRRFALCGLLRSSSSYS